MRIAYINQDFPPEVGAGPARIVELARRWQERGAHVTVITGMPNRRLPDRADGAIHPRYRGRLFLEERWEGIRVLRSWLYSSPNRSFAHTLANNASFMLSSIAHALLRGGPFDVIIASSPPFLAHLTGEAVRRVQRVPLVLEIRDLWPDYLVEMGVLRNRTAQRMLFGLERKLLRRAAHAVVVTDSFRERIAQKGFPRERISIVPNGGDLEQYRPLEEAPPLPEMARRREGEFLVGYLGNFGAGQALRTLLEAARQLENSHPEIRFVLVGDGKEKPLVETRAAELGLRNLSIHAPIEKESTRAFYNACDLCLVPLAPLAIFHETVPSKIFEIMACERPVLASVAGEAARIVEASGGGVLAPPGDAERIAERIIELSRSSRSERAAMGRRGRRFVAAHYDRMQLADAYLEQLAILCGDGRARTGAAATQPMSRARPGQRQ